MPCGCCLFLVFPPSDALTPSGTPRGYFTNLPQPRFPEIDHWERFGKLSRVSFASHYPISFLHPAYQVKAAEGCLSDRPGCRGESSWPCLHTLPCPRLNATLTTSLVDQSLPSNSLRQRLTQSMSFFGRLQRASSSTVVVRYQVFFCDQRGKRNPQPSVLVSSPQYPGTVGIKDCLDSSETRYKQ